jgi:hypothetical protein
VSTTARILAAIAKLLAVRLREYEDDPAAAELAGAQKPGEQVSGYLRNLLSTLARDADPRPEIVYSEEVRAPDAQQACNRARAYGVIEFSRERLGF